MTIDITFLITNTLLIPKGGKVLKPHRKPIFKNSLVQYNVTYQDIDLTKVNNNKIII